MYISKIDLYTSLKNMTYLYFLCVITHHVISFKIESIFQPQDFGICKVILSLSLRFCFFIRSIKPKCFYYSNNCSQNEKPLSVELRYRHHCLLYMSVQCDINLAPKFVFNTIYSGNACIIYSIQYTMSVSTDIQSIAQIPNPVSIPIHTQTPSNGIIVPATSSSECVTPFFPSC